MSLRSITAGLRTLFRRRHVDRELDDELAHFIDQATRANIRAGMSPAAAERAARAQVGSVTSARELALSGGWEARVEPLLNDARYAIRTIARSPGFAAAAVLTMALGIGANTAMFSVFNAVMLRPLPWRDAGNLALIWTDDVARGLHREPTAYRTIADWQSSNNTFADIAYFTSQRVATMPRESGGERGRSRSALVSANLFHLLGVTPAQGRAITAVDETERAAVAVISYTFWQRWFGGAPDVIGRTFDVDDGSKGGIATLTVIGVMPSGFWFPDQTTEIWTPATTYWRFDTERDERFPSWARRWTAIGRLAPGASVDDARLDLGRLGRQLAAVHATTEPDFPGFGTTVTSVLDSITGKNLQSALRILLGAVSLVLLIACVNVANLLLARGASRRHEFAVRRALGAGRGRVVRQLMTESAMLAIAGGVVGTIIATWGTTALGAAAAGFVPRIGEIATDWRVLAFALLASILSGLIFGLGPALRLSRADAGDALREAGRGTTGPRLGRSREVLVMAECALALTLLTGAGLLLRSLREVQAVDPGFDTSNVLTVRIEFPTDAPPAARERTPAPDPGDKRARARVAAANMLLERVLAVPGVTSAGFSDDLFVAGQGNESILIPGRSAEEMPTGELNEGALTPGFFSVLRVPLRSGRLLTGQDAEQKIRALWSLAPEGIPLAEKERLSTPEPVVVNEAFVRRFFPNEDPVGRRFYIDPTSKTYFYEIVGVVGDMHRQGLERSTIPEYFGPLLPTSNSRADLLVRTSGDPLTVAPSVRHEIVRALPGVSVVSVSTADALLGGFSAWRRLQTWLVAIFAFLALALAAIGIFGVVHFAIAERRREIGVRVALGASPARVARLVLREGMRAPVVGIVIGVVASLGLTRVLSAMLFGVGPTDRATFMTVALVLASVAAAACWLAGRRALRIDPVRTVRDA